MLQPGGRKKKDSKFWKDQLKKGATQFRIGSVWDDPSPAGSETAGKDASQDVSCLSLSLIDVLYKL